jgi:hypothetical protein
VPGSDGTAVARPLAAAEIAEIRRRYDALREPAECPDEHEVHEHAGLGRRACGCYVDSGPYWVCCDRHDAEALLAEMPRLLAEVERLSQIVMEREQDVAHA